MKAACASLPTQPWLLLNEPGPAESYVVFVESLPHTPTHRVAKFKMRADATLRERAIDLAPTQPKAPP